jgi:uncharacterized repeat protein (TIGR03847 family)
MPFQHIEVKPVVHITAGAVGEPGQRSFFLQARSRDGLITLRTEKEQLLMLAVSVEQFLLELQTRFPDLPSADAQYEEASMALMEPLDPVFHTGSMGLGYDDHADRLLLVVREMVSAEMVSDDASEASFWCTRTQLRQLARWSSELAGRGRPLCGNCGNPIDPGGHFCVRRNGHKH